MLAIVSRQISHVLLGQADRNTDHRGMLAITFGIGRKGIGDEFGRLARDLRGLVNFRKTGLVAHDAMAANAHRGLGLSCFDISLHILRHSRQGHRGDKNGEGGGK